MADYVLIHGTFQGGWIWRVVAPRLQAKGHRVLRPTLDGCAERAGTLRPEITSGTWGKEIAQLMFFEDFRNVILVGTSMGATAAAHAAQETPERIGRIVLIDGLLPGPGETIAQAVNRKPYDPSSLVYESKTAYDDLDEVSLRTWAKARYTPQPRIPSDGPIDLHKFWSLKWKATVVRCSQHDGPPQAHQRKNAERLGVPLGEIDAGHYAPISHPDIVANLLLGCATLP
jgi:pimeloyl-ACP methyl ester carboxylesterase